MKPWPRALDKNTRIDLREKYSQFQVLRINYFQQQNCRFLRCCCFENFAIIPSRIMMLLRFKLQAQLVSSQLAKRRP
jgi:hypothetical protein